MGSSGKQLLVMSLLSSLLAIAVISAPNTSMISVLCNGGKYTRGDPFAISLAYVLADLIENTPSSKGRNYYNISPFPNAFAYGHASCSSTANLTNTDCSTCLCVAVADMNNTCSMSIGARSVLRDCNIRYEQYPFVD